MDKKQMIIGLDLSPLSTGHRYRGVGYYARYLAAALKKVDCPDCRFLELNSLDGKKIDLVHRLFFDLFQPTLKVDPATPTVVTVHDVIPLLFKNHYPPGFRGRLNFLKQKQQLFKAKAVITDSKASKKDIEQHLGLEKEKIKVVYLAPGKGFGRLSQVKIAPLIKKYQLPEKYVMYAGDVNYHKNLFLLTKVCHQMKLPLVIVGKQAAMDDLDLSHPELKPWGKVLAKYSKSKYLIRLGFLPEKDLVAVYNNASLYCQPSLYEGFGLPVLEAMACGVPVISSDRGSLPEVGGKAVLYFNPEDIDSMKRVIEKVLSDKEIRGKLVNSGFDRVKGFSWEKTARETIKVYLQVYEKH